MIKDKQVVACTPYGRKTTVSVLMPYMRRDHERGLLDQWQLWMNTDPGSDQRGDRNYAGDLAREYDWIVLKDAPPHRKMAPVKQYNTRTFFEYCIEPDTVYVRFDDDIVFVHEDALENLVKAKLSSPAFVAFPIIWNNAISSWHLQMQGRIPREWGPVQPYCMDAIGWSDGPFAERIHNYLLDHIESDSVEELFLYNAVQLPLGQQFSVSCFACPSEEYHAHCITPGFIDDTDDEAWHSVIMPQKLNRPNVIVADSLVSHYTFYPQRDYILRTKILDRYRAASESL